jgi:hypothetical protein
MTDDLELLTMADFKDCGDSDWGGWELEGTYLSCAPYAHNDMRYEFSITRCRSSAKVLDFIMQVAGKSWATAPLLAGLVRAFDDILRPQENLCSGGRDKRLTEVQIEEMCLERQV